MNVHKNPDITIKIITIFIIHAKKKDSKRSVSVIESADTASCD